MYIADECVVNFVITKDLLADGGDEGTNCNAKGMVRRSEHAEEMTAEQIKNHKDAEFFQIFDDDDTHYYSGYMVSDGGEDADFAPLTWATWNAGCSYMKIRNKKTGKMDCL